MSRHPSFSAEQYDEFKAHMTRMYADEGLLFHEALLALEAMPSEDERQKHARYLVEVFVLETAPKQVMLHSETQRAIVEAYEAERPISFELAHKEILRDLYVSDGYKSFVQRHDLRQVN